MQENMWIDWLNRRGITTDTIEDFGLHATTHVPIGDCIAIPILDSDGKFFFNKYRRDPSQGDLKPKYIYDTGGRATLFGAYKIKNETSVLITEGELDALVAWSSHIPAVSSTGGAGTFMPEWAPLLEGKEITLCFDNDEAGGAGMVKALTVVPSAYVLFLPDRPGIKDISDYVGGGGNLTELMRSRMNFTSLQDVQDDRSVRLASWQSTYFHDAYIEAHTQPLYLHTKRIFTGDMDKIARAKSHPITELLKFNREHKALCIWHAEKTPSLHYFKKNNTVWCFGCGKGGDAIDVYRQLFNCTFGTAVDNL